MTLTELLLHCRALLPEAAVALTICAVITADMFVPLRKSRTFGVFFAAAGLACALMLLAYEPAPDDPAGAGLFFFGMISADPLAQILRAICLIGGLFVALFSERSNELADYRFGEYLALILGAVLASCFIALANNFLLYVIAFETLSLCCYVLAAYQKHGRRPAEASLKYLLYGAVASAIMLFGISYLYGLTGTLAIDESMKIIAQQALLGPHKTVVGLSLLLVISGIGFKIAMFPFHFWCPDVYEGAPAPVTAFLSVVSKTAGFAALLRLAAPVLSSPELAGFMSPAHQVSVFHLFFGVAAVVTMTFGNLSAIKQEDAKRMLAYSSIAHAGYLLLGMAVFDRDAIQSMLAYLFVYLFMNLAAFWVLILLVRETGSAKFSSFRGFAYHNPALFIILFLSLVSLTGLPPTAGFAAKFLLFKAVVAAGITSLDGQALLSTGACFYFLLAVAGVLNSVVSLFYYMKFARVMVFEQPEAGAAATHCTGLDLIYGTAVGLPVLALLYFDPVVRMVDGVLKPALPVIIARLQ